jgi:hypothetical protein
MTENQAKLLTGIVIKNFRIEDIISPKYVNNVINESDGHPYIIKILLGEVAK